MLQFIVVDLIYQNKPTMIFTKGIIENFDFYYNLKLYNKDKLIYQATLTKEDADKILKKYSSKIKIY